MNRWISSTEQQTTAARVRLPPPNTRAEFRCLTHPGNSRPEISHTLLRDPLDLHHLNPAVAKFVTAGFSLAPTKRQRRIRRNIASLRNKLRHVPQPWSTGSSTQRDTVLPPLAPDLAPRTPKLSVSDRCLQSTATQANESWSMDFMADQLFSAQRFRLLTLVDNFTREAQSDRGTVS